MFRGFLRFFMRTFSYKSCDSEEFKKCFIEYFDQKIEKAVREDIYKKIKWDDWLKKPGFPPENVGINISDFDDCKALAERFMNENDVTNIVVENYNSFDVTLKVIFLKQLYEKFEIISRERLVILKESLNLIEEKNKEILFVWLRLCIKNKYLDILNIIEEFLGSTGRMKFVIPLYVELNKLDKKLAGEVYDKNKALYHSITKQLILKKTELA